VFDRGARA